MPHDLQSQYVHDQLALRSRPLNEKRLQPDGEFILYWMQSTQRLEHNWGLRLATREADRIGKPLLIVQGLDPHYRFASERFHTFVMQGAKEIAARADALGLEYRFVLKRDTSEKSRALDMLVSRAAVVVTDDFPTAGVPERSALIASRANCRTVAVDSAGIVPVASFPKEEYAARTIRPKLMRMLDLALEPVEDRAPRKRLDVRFDIDWLDIGACDIAAEVARCGIDRAVGPVESRGGLAAARERLDLFVTDGLLDYSERRRNPDDVTGSSRLSPYLHHGMISPQEIAEMVREADVPVESEAFLNEMCTWRELSLNFCTRNPRHMSLDALPAWVHGTMRAHAKDRRTVSYTLEQLEGAETYDALWNAGQRELMRTGTMHNVVRMLWGKSILLWAPTYKDALEWMIHLNDKYAIDGRDANSYAGIQWCLGKFDRPFAERPVLGTIRPMSLERARKKYALAGYLARWSR